MKKYFFLCLILIFGISSYSRLYAEDEYSNDNMSKIKFTGSGYMMFGQVVSGHTHSNQSECFVENHWQNSYAGRVNFLSEPTEWFKTKISLEIASTWPLVREGSIMKEIYKSQFSANLPQAVGILDFDFNFMSFMFEMGMMEYAFNKEVKNLGNYLYRSQAYPLFLTTNLDYIYSNLLGIRPEFGFLDNSLKVSAMLNFNTLKPPFFDINLGFFFSYITPKKFFDVGLGMCLDRFIAMDPEKTDADNLPDIITDSSLTFRSTKFDARFTFDPKVFFSNNSIFGPNDLKFYAETAILGIKDPDYYPKDPGGYPLATDTLFPRPSLWHRIPIMIGVNIPTFKALDYFTVEFEYLKYPYAFNWWGPNSGNPTPQIIDVQNSKRWIKNYKDRDNIKWTVYIKKSISNLDIIALFGNDHITYPTFNAESHTNTEQSLRTNWDGHWYLKLQYNL
ncbi:MAG: hypothetical protein GXY77_08080 [Fibrobacter sp.]|nr:hypothetical protein [Fibrobacter sp.]